MVRFIVVTFAFLGWAFYEMSGGDAFVPAKAELAAAQAKSVNVASASAGTREFDGTAEVTRVALDLASLESVVRGDNPQSTRLPQQPQPEVQQASLSDTDQGESVVIIPSLVTNATVEGVPFDSVVVEPGDLVETAAQPVQQATLRDLRAVTGDRVNVRGGPGKDFSVVAKLVRGDEVEILEDTGDGWVRFQAVGSDKAGWLADFLLTGG